MAAKLHSYFNELKTHYSVENREIHSHRKNISWNQLINSSMTCFHESFVKKDNFSMNKLTWNPNRSKKARLDARKLQTAFSAFLCQCTHLPYDFRTNPRVRYNSILRQSNTKIYFRSPTSNHLATTNHFRQWSSWIRDFRPCLIVQFLEIHPNRSRT